MFEEELLLMSDDAGRDAVRLRLYELRHPDDWVPSDQIASDLRLPVDEVHRYLRQLFEFGDIDARFLRSGRGTGLAHAMAKIKGQGVVAVESRALAAPPDRASPGLSTSGAQALGLAGTFEPSGNLAADATVAGGPTPPPAQPLSIEKNATYYLLLARSLERQALDEIEKLKGQRPNDARGLERHERELDLLSMFAAGFAEIAAALEAVLTDQDQPVLTGKALAVAKTFADKLSAWWEAHGDGIVLSGVQIGLVGAGVAMLGLLNVTPNLAASIVGALVGGKEVVAAIRAYTKRD